MTWIFNKTWYFAVESIGSASGEMRDIAIKICPKFLEELLHDLRSVKHARGNHRAKCEASCIISISRININAANYPDVHPNKNMIKICKEGLASYEAQFGNSALTKEYYGYMLNNMRSTCNSEISNRLRTISRKHSISKKKLPIEGEMQNCVHWILRPKTSKSALCAYAEK